MEYNIEGTFTVDGMIEGPIPGMPDAKERLSAWAEFAKTRHLHFSMEFRAESFSAVARSKTGESAKLGAHPEEHVQETLDKLVKILPAEQRNRLLSTVRLIEFRPNREIQNVYAVTPMGELEILQRELEAETMPPLIPMDKGARIKLGLIAAVVTLAVLLISSLFVNYKELVMGFFGHEKRVAGSALKVTTGSFSPYLTVKTLETTQKGRAVAITLARTALYPDTPAKLQALLLSTPSPKGGAAALTHRLTIEALFRGYVVIEMFSEGGTYLGSQLARVKELELQKTVLLTILLPEGTKTAAISLTP